MAIDLICVRRLKKANIIPTILDPFGKCHRHSTWTTIPKNIFPLTSTTKVPLLTLNATWKKAAADLGNTIKPKKAKKQPFVHFLDTVPSSSDTNEESLKLLTSGIQLTIALTDPDAPSRDNPEWSQICHWIATDVPLTALSDANDFLVGKHKDKHHQSFTEIMPYKAPGPPPKTGKHRYVFVALAPVNGTTEKLDLSTPKDRQRWGFEGERAGLREWARENGLGVVGELFSILVLVGIW
jgi:phosphatidylethanolamine-binding protein (PEBP) family uncharacterized protein